MIINKNNTNSTPNTTSVTQTQSPTTTLTTTTTFDSRTHPQRQHQQDTLHKNLTPGSQHTYHNLSSSSEASYNARESQRTKENYLQGSGAMTSVTGSKRSADTMASHSVELAQDFEESAITETSEASLHNMTGSPQHVDTSQPQRVETSDLNSHSDYHQDHFYEPVVNGEEDEARALEEEASAAVYAKEVLGAPGDDDMSLSGVMVATGVSNTSTKDANVNAHGTGTTGVDVAGQVTNLCDSNDILQPPTKRLRVEETMTLAGNTVNLIMSEHNGESTKDVAMTDEGFASAHASIAPSTSFPSATTASLNKKVHNEQWNEMLERLRAYKERHGDCLVPKRYQQDPKLGTWVETQRVQYKRLPRVYSEELGYEVSQPNKRLTQERLDKLQQLGFSWSAKHIRKNSNKTKKDAKSSAQMRMDSPSRSAQSEFLQMPSAGMVEGNDKSSTQSYDTDSLQSISSATRARTNADQSYADYSLFESTLEPSRSVSQTENPMACPPATRPVPNMTCRKKGGLASNGTSISATTKWNSDAVWEEMFNRLVAFREKEGNCLVPRKYEADPKLATWVETQRVLWNRDYNQNGSKSKVSQSTGQGKPAAVPATGEETAKNLFPSVGILKQLSLERKERLDSIGFVWSLRSKRIEDHWDQMFQQLAEYKNQHGDCLVPSRYEANLKLGKWVETQRYEFTKLQRATTQGSEQTSASNPPSSGRTSNPRLTPERLRRLESIGFEWKVKNKMKRYYDKQWDVMFQRLLEFRKQYGHVNVPKRFPDDVKLGTWVHTQRIQYRKLMMGNSKGKAKKDGQPVTSSGEGSGTEMGTRSDSPTGAFERDGSTPIDQTQSFRLTEERRIRLEDIGFCWSAREGERGSGANSPSGLANTSTQGGTVVSGRMTRNSYDDQWDAMFILLEKYKAETGNCLVPKRYPANPKLGTWVDTQRVQYKKLQKKIAELQSRSEANDQIGGLPEEQGSNGQPNSKAAVVGRLTQDRIHRLQNLGFVWSLRDDWSKHYEELKAYRELHGHCNVPARYSDNRRLGIWVSAQRQQYKILQQQKHLQVEAAFLGHADSDTPAVKTADGNAAGGKARRSAPLTQERIDLLNAIGFTWTIRSRDSLGESWNQRLQELRHFKFQHGHCLVPSRYELNPELGIWVGTQRTQYRLYMRAKESGLVVATSMNESRVRELEELGFVWALRGGGVQDEVPIGPAPPARVPGHVEVDMGAGIAVTPGTMMGQTLGNSGSLSPSIAGESGTSLCNELVAPI